MEKALTELRGTAEWLRAAYLLGLKRPAHGVAFVDLVGRGLPVRSLERVVALVAPTDTSLKPRLVPKPSSARRKASKRLSARESARVTRLASVWANTVRIWKSDDAARDFLYRSHPLLQGRRPIDLVLKSKIGA